MLLCLSHSRFSHIDAEWAVFSHVLVTTLLDAHISLKRIKWHVPSLRIKWHVPLMHMRARVGAGAHTHVWRDMLVRKVIGG